MSAHLQCLGNFAASQHLDPPNVLDQSLRLQAVRRHLRVCIKRRFQRIEVHHFERLAINVLETADVRQAAQSTGLTKEQVEEILKTQSAQKDQAYVNLSKDIAYVTMDHFQRFKEPVDVDALEAFAIKSGLPLRQAYKEFVAPKVDEQRNAEFDAKLKAAREEGARDALSKHQLPINTRPKEAHLVFDRSEKPDQPVSELQQDRNSKEAFLEAFNNYQEKAS